MSGDRKRPIPLSKIAEHLRTQHGLSPVLRQVLAENQSRSGAHSEDDDFHIQQFALILKAADMAANTGYPANFNFAAGYIAGTYLSDEEYTKAKAIAATL